MTLRAAVRAFVLRALVAVPLAVSGVSVPGTGQAGPLTDAASAIEALIAQGRTEDAVVAARRFMRGVTDITGFGVTNAQLITAPATGFGIFERRNSNVYVTGEPVFAYVEVYGFSMTPQPSGLNQLRFDVSFTLDGQDGRQLTPDMIPMGDIQLDSYSEPLDGYFHLTYRVTGATGSFNLRTSVTDRESGQVTEFSLPVVFEAPPAPRAPLESK